MRISILALAVLALLSTVGLLHADDTAPATPAQPAAAETPADAAPATKAVPGPNHAAFQKYFGQFKEILTQLQKMKLQYASASDAEKKELQEKYSKLLEEAIELESKLAKSAEAAYAEDPKTDPQLELFLRNACAGKFQFDNYEESYRLAKLLMDHGCQSPKIELIAGVSAYCIGKLDEAETLLKKLARAGQNLQTKKETLDSLVGMFLAEPSTYKKAWAEEQAIRAKEAKADDLPRVRMKTDRGDIVIELFENEAPNATANFLSLVEKGFYDGLGFHRVLDGFMAQGGCPNGDGSGGPGYKILSEFHKPDARKHSRGSLSMANTNQKNTGGSQFFLTFVPTSFLDGRHTVFGRVIEGIDVIGDIRRRDPSDPKQALGPSDKIIKAEVLRKRDHEYEPQKAGE